MKLECYRCGTTYNLLIEERINKLTEEVIEKNFVCIRCSDRIIEQGKGQYK